jgi:hypothetical protein
MQSDQYTESVEQTCGLPLLPVYREQSEEAVQETHTGTGAVMTAPPSEGVTCTCSQGACDASAIAPLNSSGCLLMHCLIQHTVNEAGAGGWGLGISMMVTL